jgi:hypothetical protein
MAWTGAGMLLGAGVASLIDGLWLAREDCGPAPATPLSTLRLGPSVTKGGGGLALGMHF